MAPRALALALLVIAAPAARADDLKNWYDDPYFQVRDAVAACPTPRGPLMTADEMRRSAHARTERGTRCWLEGQCAKANAYLYDAAIADEVRRRFASSRQLRQASLWVTVQRRFVYVEGCAADTDAEKRVRQLLRGVPDVEEVVVNVARDTRAPAPYAVLEQR
jgi:hypothetical protein